MSDAGPAAPSTVAEALAHAKRLGVDRLDAQWLLGRLLDRPRSWLAAHPDTALSADRADALAALLGRLADDEPLAYLLGKQAFHGLVLHVDRRVLVPRADTGALVDWALACLDAAVRGPGPATPRVVDLGTGSGAIALAVRRGCPRATVVATDVSAAALAVARANAERLGLELAWREGAWWQAVDGEPAFDLALANPPYLATADPHLPALRHEPALALVSGADGLDALRTIVAGAGRHLVAGGRLLLEHGVDQGPAVQALLRAAGFGAIETRRDLGGRPRCTGGVRAG